MKASSVFSVTLMLTGIYDTVELSPCGSVSEGLLYITDDL